MYTSSDEFEAEKTTSGHRHQGTQMPGRSLKQKARDILGLWLYSSYISMDTNISNMGLLARYHRIALPYIASS
jgi:hypothetical protein